MAGAETINEFVNPTPLTVNDFTAEGPEPTRYLKSMIELVEIAISGNSLTVPLRAIFFVISVPEDKTILPVYELDSSNPDLSLTKTVVEATAPKLNENDN